MKVRVQVRHKFFSSDPLKLRCFVVVTCNSYSMPKILMHVIFSFVILEMYTLSTLPFNIGTFSEFWTDPGFIQLAVYAYVCLTDTWRVQNYNKTKQ